jgi:hypothetical protein
MTHSQSFSSMKEYTIEYVKEYTLEYVEKHIPSITP